MFNAERWAEAYWAACARAGEDPARGLCFLETVLAAAGKIGRNVSGTHSADKFTALVLRAAKKTGVDGVMSAAALVRLLIRRGHLEKSGHLIEAIGRFIDEKNRALRVTLELAGEDEDFPRELEAALIKERGASSVKIETKVNPALLGGFRWTAGSERADFSLAGSLERMAQAAGAETAALAGNG